MKLGIDINSKITPEKLEFTIMHFVKENMQELENHANSILKQTTLEKEFPRERNEPISLDNISSYLDELEHLSKDTVRNSTRIKAIKGLELRPSNLKLVDYAIMRNRKELAASLIEQNFDHNYENIKYASFHLAQLHLKKLTELLKDQIKNKKAINKINAIAERQNISLVEHAFSSNQKKIAHSLRANGFKIRYKVDELITKENIASYLTELEIIADNPKIKGSKERVDILLSLDKKSGHLLLEQPHNSIIAHYNYIKELNKQTAPNIEEINSNKKVENLFSNLVRMGFKLSNEKSNEIRTTHKTSLSAQNSAFRRNILKNITSNDQLRLKIIGDASNEFLESKEINLKTKPSPLYIALKLEKYSKAVELLKSGYTLKKSEIAEFYSNENIERSKLSKLGLRKMQDSKFVLRYNSPAHFNKLNSKPSGRVR